MNGELRGRQGEDEPAATDIKMAKAENVPKERPIGVGGLALNDGVSSNDHGGPPRGRWWHDKGSAQPGHPGCGGPCDAAVQPRARGCPTRRAGLQVRDRRLQRHLRRWLTATWIAESHGRHKRPSPAGRALSSPPTCTAHQMCRQPLRSGWGDSTSSGRPPLGIHSPELGTPS